MALHRRGDKLFPQVAITRNNFRHIHITRFYPTKNEGDNHMSLFGMFKGFNKYINNISAFRFTILSVSGMKWLAEKRNVFSYSLRWRHNGRDSVSNHQAHHCLLNRYSDADQRKHQSSASLAFVWGIHRGPVNSSHNWPVTRKMFPFDNVMLPTENRNLHWFHYWSIQVRNFNATKEKIIK